MTEYLVSEQDLLYLLGIKHRWDMVKENFFQNDWNKCNLLAKQDLKRYPRYIEKEDYTLWEE